MAVSLSPAQRTVVGRAASDSQLTGHRAEFGVDGLMSRARGTWCGRGVHFTFEADPTVYTGAVTTIPEFARSWAGELGGRARG